MGAPGPPRRLGRLPARPGGLSLGCGLLVERAAGGRLPGPLVSRSGWRSHRRRELATLTDATAELAAPLVAGSRRRAAARAAPAQPARPWASGAAVAVFAVFAAPIVLSGEATFAGYIKLDDTATWFAITDRVMEHGRDLAGLAPSSYEATLDSRSRGYPSGSLPLGIGHELLG